MANNNILTNITDLNSPGVDTIKGGIFFGSNLTPAGTFSNVPNYLVTNPTLSTTPSLVLTLQMVKDSLNQAIKNQTGASSTNNSTLESYLVEFVDLLIDYRDIRNYVFYGSANTELAYNINWLINNYPYQTLISEPETNSFISFNYYVDNGIEMTDIVFPETYYFTSTNYVRVISDNFNFFNLYDDSITQPWSNYEIVDNNNNRYKITNVVTPYKSSTIFDVLNIENITETIVFPATYDTVRITTTSPHNYIVGQNISFFGLKCIDPTQELQYNINVFDTVTLTYDINYSYTLNGAYFVIDSIPAPNQFTIRRAFAQQYENMYIIPETGVLPGIVDYDSSISNIGSVRLYPDTNNLHPFGIKITIIGNFNFENFINFTNINGSFRSFIIAPLISTLNSFQVGLTPVQNMLLSPAPINPTPWPRRPITNNIMNISSGDDIEQMFVTWLSDPSSLYVPLPTDPTDVDAAWSNWGLNYEYNMVRALALDETETNQLVRRCIPADIISEIFDTPDNYFQRFILIAGWLFDNIKLYAEFVNYAHTINYTPYNQLSPQYYKYLSDNWGLTLFNDDSIDFSKLVIQTVPGDYFGVSDTEIESNAYYQQTLQQLQYSREKNLLYSLIYLYKHKGTQYAIEELISLLGAPDGFLNLQEYAFQVNDLDNIGYPTNGYAGNRIVDNEKVHVPAISFEIDPDYLLDPININNQINKPYVYRQLLSNEYTHNLREISVLTDPNGALDNQIINNFGAQLYNYITFAPGEFTNLQKLNNFWLMPLSIPDRFYGMSFDYMIPRNGMRKGVGNDQEEATCNLFSLYRIAPISASPTYEVFNITLNTAGTIATISLPPLSLPPGYIVGDNIFIYNMAAAAHGINGINDGIFAIESMISGTEFTIVGNFSGTYIPTGGSITDGLVTKGTLTEFNNTGTDDLIYTYPLAIQYPQSNRTIDTSFATDTSSTPIPDGFTNPASDFNVLQSLYPSATYIQDSYVITRLEGEDLVVRLRMQSEVTSVYGERVAIFENIFAADGLNHSIRMVLREVGVEIYKDYVYIGIAKWMNIADAGPYHAYEIPKSEIKMLLDTSDPCTNSFEPIAIDDFLVTPSIYHLAPDNFSWWDLFVGMPQGVEVYLKKLNFFENDTVNDYNIGDKIVDSANDTAEFYVFEVANPIMNSTTTSEALNFNIPALFYEIAPNFLPAYYGFALPTVVDQYGRNIITDLALTNKRSPNVIATNNLILNSIQDFFEFADVFGNNAWMHDIHKAYNYELFMGELIHLYELYSQQVLTYTELEPFMELVEQKFKSTFESFIPMVVNVYEYGRLIRNSIFNQAKMRIPGSNKICNWHLGPTPAVMYTYFYTGIAGEPATGYVTPGGPDFQWVIIDASGLPIIAGGDDISWAGSERATLEALAADINAWGFGTNMVASVYSNMIRIAINYDWCLSTFSVDANNLIFTARIIGGGPTYSWPFHSGAPTISGSVPATYDSCGTLVTYAYNDLNACGSITYRLPNLPVITPYIYFESEDMPPSYIHFSTEFADPYIVHFDPTTEPM